MTTTTSPPQLFLAAGEVSGDVHGAALAQALRALAPEVELVGWGSHRMKEAGVTVVEDLVPHAAVGLTENLGAVRPAARAIKAARAWLSRRKPACVVLIDYQGANMVLARHAREMGIPTVYYISPQEWIWGFKGGPAKVAKQVDRILCIFEREAKVYRDAGGQVRFVGHPLLDQAPEAKRLADLRGRLGIPAGAPVLGLFPGSRRAEIGRLVPPMVAAARALRSEIPDLEVVMPLASPHFRDLVAELAGSAARVVEDAPGIDVLALCTAALVASGTVTLEAAVVGTPVVAAYRVSPLTAFLARKVFGISHVTLPNIIAGREIIPELLQERANPEAMVAQIRPLLQPGARRDAAVADLAHVRGLLGERGATRRAAAEILAAAGLIGLEHPA
ncbi:MAG: lipid-A-disaccharide synthase [Candidatus Sericytochromatia bacterium]|nr:lipid-A-disaccharide synthase [Candidatus Tanganyikabacteria bacterium]